MKTTETQNANKKEKAKPTVVPIHVWPESKELLLELVQYTNKDALRPVARAAIIHCGLKKVKRSDLDDLKDQALSNEDRLEQMFQSRHSETGITKEEFYAAILQQITSSRQAHGESSDEGSH